MSKLKIREITPPFNFETIAKEMLHSLEDKELYSFFEWTVDEMNARKEVRDAEQKNAAKNEKEV